MCIYWPPVYYGHIQVAISMHADICVLEFTCWRHFFQDDKECIVKVGQIVRIWYVKLKENLIVHK